MGKGQQHVRDKLRTLSEDLDAISVSDRVIFCRNMMICFDKPTQQELINRFWDYLEPGGRLFVGHSGGPFVGQALFSLRTAGGVPVPEVTEPRTDRGIHEPYR
jgi:chemotaxis methyl-accepting protein methylase